MGSSFPDIVPAIPDEPCNEDYDRPVECDEFGEDAAELETGMDA